jgi:hypothetical protein
MPARLISPSWIARRLGAEGMDEVFLAHDTSLERCVTLKGLSAEAAKDPHQRQRCCTVAKAGHGNPNQTHPPLTELLKNVELEK